MKNQLFHTILSYLEKGIFLLVLFLLPSYFSEYREHYFSEYRKNSTVVSWEGVTAPSFMSGKLLILPNKGVQESLLRTIETAKKRVWVEMYTWTDTKMLDAVVRASKRWVDVRVILERNVYGTPGINRKVFDILDDANVSVVYADNHRYTFTHAKFWIIDEKYFISTGNWTVSFFTKNRDAIFVDSDRRILDFLEEMFLADYAHRAFLDLGSIPSGMIISPLNSRERIENIINGTKKEVSIYVQTLTDESILASIEKLIEVGVTVHVCVADNKEVKEKFLNVQYPVAFVRKPYLHGKFILRDGEWIFLGSQNFTKNSLENNREVGFFTSQNPSLYTELHALFEQDCIFR